MTKDLRFLNFAFIVVLLQACGTTPPDKCQVQTELVTEMQQSSYAQGVSHMKNLRKYDTAFDQVAFLMGLNDVQNNRQLQLSPEQLQSGLDWVIVQQVKYNDKVAPLNLAEGKAFLDANKQNQGVIILPSGLQYKVLAVGKGTRKPSLKDAVSVHYRISRINGDELTESGKDSKSPTEIKVGNVIKGWQEALLLMVEGDKWQLYVPSNLAYGEMGAPSVGLEPNETLIYEVELVAVAQPSANTR